MISSQRNNHTTLQRNNHATLQRINHATLQHNNPANLQHNNQNYNVVVDLLFLQNPSKQRCHAIFLLNLFTFRNLTENFQLTYACQVTVM
jgi:hypothetical protein